MTLNDLLRQGRSITEQLNSGDIPLIDAEGKGVNIQLALRQPIDKLVCEIAFVRRRLDSMTQEEWKELKDLIRLVLKYHAENLAMDFHTESEEEYIYRKIKNNEA